MNISGSRHCPKPPKRYLQAPRARRIESAVLEKSEFEKK
jgi:hypothetical protein